MEEKRIKADLQRQVSKFDQKLVRIERKLNKTMESQEREESKLFGSSLEGELAKRSN